MATPAPSVALDDTHLASDAPWPAGTLVLDGRFRVARLLGGGGMGLVYLAEQVSLGRQVALKVLRADLAAQEGMGERFRREALLLSSVEHPSVVRVIDFGQHGTAMCLVMEYVEGESLQRVIERDAPVSVDRAERLLTQLAEGLSAIHAKGIVHRDLKPDNVVVSVDAAGHEQARVLDFGIARLAEPDQRQQVTQFGLVIGTPEYMSPEQALGQPLDARSDVYALGLIAFRLVTGRHAFEGPSPQEMVSQQIHQPPPSLLDVAPALATAPGLVNTITACLHKTPGARPASAQAFVASLKAAALPSALSVAPTRLLPRGPRFSRGHKAAAGAIAGALLVVGLVWFMQPERVARRLLGERRGSEALQVIEEAGGASPSSALQQLWAAALYQVGRSDEARKMLEAMPATTSFEPEAIEFLADDYGQNEGKADGQRVRKLVAKWPKAQVLPLLQRLATRGEGWAQWGALRFTDLEYAGQGLPLVDLYLRALAGKDCGRRVIAAKRLGELRADAAVDALTRLKDTPKKRGGLLGLEEDDCGQSAAAAALRRIERATNTD